MVAGPAGAFAGRVCVVTGATSGIGRETALGLARMGARVIALARSRERGEALMRDVRERTGSEGVEVVLADLASLAQVRRAAEEILGRHQRLHVLVNNAGILAGGRVLTEDGVEQTMAVNHLAPFLLTNLLLEALAGGGTPERKARVVTVASDAHRAGRIDFRDFNYERRYRAMRAYCASKLANVLFTYELARRLQAEGKPVAAYAVHPGSVRTSWGRGAGGPFSILWRVIAPFLLSAERGAQPVLRAASSPELEAVNGVYVTQKGVERSSPASYDPDAAREVWEVSERLTRRG